MGEKLRNICSVVERALGLLSVISLRALEEEFQLQEKNAQDFMVYQRLENGVSRSLYNDRVFPLETVALHSFRTGHQSDIEKANIHIGPYADELAHSMNALAVVMGSEIYFRNNAYQPESEEGRKVIAHELTHITQFNEKRMIKNDTKDALEREAELAEAVEVYDPDPYEPYVAGNKVYRLRRSQIETVTKLAADGIEEWVAEQKYLKDEQDYSELLYAYNEWLEEENN
jgi:hypothetical protein